MQGLGDGGRKGKRKAGDRVFPRVSLQESNSRLGASECPVCSQRECGSAALRPKPGINRQPLQRQLLKMFLIKVQEDLYVQYLLA
jgi:hypothetical protein